MTTRAPEDPAGWATTGVDLETRRLRVLAGLARLGRTAEQQRFQARYRALLAIADALADGYVQAKYQHVRIALTTSGRAERGHALYRRRNPRAFDRRTSLPAHPTIHGGLQVEADADSVPDYGEAERFWMEG